MSYCRMSGDSDVYVIASTTLQPIGGKARQIWVCYCEAESYVADTRKQMLNHLEYHKRKGDRVPDYAIERLKKEESEA